MKPIPFGKFTLLEQVAAGGMAEVYRAQVTDSLGNPMMVAIKRILPQYTSDQEFISLLIDEAKVMVQLNHPNIVPMIEFGKVEDSYYIAMEYVTGCTLKDLFKRVLKKGDVLTIDMGVHIIREIGNGLAYAHRKRNENGDRLGLVHRDISPANILLSHEGDVKIADFGISKADTQSHKTEIGVIRGKTGYMSPEQTRSQLVLDQRSDIYSLGIIFFELLTGKRLYKAKSIPEALKKVREGAVPPIRELRPEVPVALEKIIMRALAKDPEDRYQSADDFVDELNEFLVKWAPEGRPARVTHADLAGFIQRYFEPTAPEVEAPKTAVVSGERTVVDSASVSGTRTAVERKDQPIATNPQYELSQSESVAPKTEIAGPKNAETMFLPTSSFNDAFSKTVYLAKTFSPIVISAILAGIVVVAVLYWLVYDTPQIVAPPPAKIAVKISSRPAKARIVLNSTLLDRFTPDVLDLVEGKKVEIELRKEGYEPFRHTLEPMKGMAQLAPFVLKPKTSTKPKYASIRVETDPSGAKVYLNDGLMGGETPMLIEKLNPGTEYKIRIEKDGYEPALETHVPEDPKSVGLSYILQKKVKRKAKPKKRVTVEKPKPLPKLKTVVQAKPGLMTIGSKPYGEVLLGGKKIGETPFAKRVVPSGEHQIELRSLDGSDQSYTTRIKVNPEEHIRCIYDIPAKTEDCTNLGSIQ